MELSYLNVAIKLIMGLLSLVLVINISGKGNLAPSSAIILINKGILDVEACRRMGLTANDIAFKLRTNGVYSVRKVKRAVLEQNGQLIIVLQDEENPKYPIITDGTVQTNILEAIDKDTDWLQEQLKEMGYENISDIFLAEYDSGKITVITY